MVADAVSTKGRFVRLADRVAVPFTLVAFAVAALAWWVSGDPVRFAQVLVVATPCPLLVAAPTALVAGMDRAARLGIVVKGGDALERMASARVAAFDKTGTLTVGEPRLARVDVAPGAGYDAETLLGIAAAIVAGARDRDRPVVARQHVREDVGQGMRAEWQGRPVRVGRLAHVADPAHPHEPEPLAPGELAVYIAISGLVSGRLVLRDEVRPGAAEALAELRELGFERVVMLTGDGAANAAWAAAETGVTEVHSDLRPGGKVAVLESAGRTIMVGDGVNDAPVLAAADVGIAMANRGASAASETADVVLLLGDLGLVPQAVRLSRRTMRIARQSVVVGVGLSVVLMLIAATGVIPALAGALAQEAVDVLTILNGLRAAGVTRRRGEPRAPVRSR
jgi:P-type E1-E2 ATPase